LFLFENILKDRNILKEKGRVTNAKTFHACMQGKNISGAIGREQRDVRERIYLKQPYLNSN